MGQKEKTPQSILSVLDEILCGHLFLPSTTLHSAPLGVHIRLFPLSIRAMILSRGVNDTDISTTVSKP